MRPLAGILGEGATHSGDLVFEGPARIDGTVHGTVRSDDLVEIGRTGQVIGDVVARQALVAGSVVGRVEGSERVTVLESASLEADIITPWLDVRLGARLQGMVRVARPREST
jgi:cytoskeletal protein CcmA (bactofilin family)